MTNFLCVHKTYGIATPRSSGLGSTLHLKASAFQTYPIPRTHHEKKGSLKRASGWSVGRERSNTLSRHEFFFSCELCKPTHMPYGDSPFQLYNYIGTSENNSDLQLSNSACWGPSSKYKIGYQGHGSAPCCCDKDSSSNWSSWDVHATNPKDGAQHYCGTLTVQIPNGSQAVKFDNYKGGTDCYLSGVTVDHGAISVGAINFS